MKKRTKKGIWKKMVKQETRQGDRLKKAIRDAKKRYDIYKKTGKVPKVI